MELSDNNSLEKEPMLTTIEARILGALMEKQMTTPDAYPLTLNSLVLACNQKTSREPTTNYEQGEVQRCISDMQDRKLIDVDYGARAARYDQRLTRIIGADKATQALLNVMLLRGPQTLAELLTRTQRMFEFGNMQELEEKMEQLCAKTSPVVVHIPRLPGQREDRYTHLLCGKPDLTAMAAISHSSTKSTTTNTGDDRIVALEQNIENLEELVKQLQQQVAALMELNGITESDVERK